MTPQTIAEIYTKNYLPPFRLYTWIVEQAEQRPVSEEARQWIERVGQVYGTQAIELDTAQETTR